MRMDSTILEVEIKKEIFKLKKSDFSKIHEWMFVCYDWVSPILVTMQSQYCSLSHTISVRHQHKQIHAQFIIHLIIDQKIHERWESQIEQQQVYRFGFILELMFQKRFVCSWVLIHQRNSLKLHKHSVIKSY